MADDIRRERHNVTGEKLLETVKRILHEGNVRRLIIKDHDDRTIIEVPLTVGVVGVLVAPVAAALGGTFRRIQFPPLHTCISAGPDFSIAG